VLPSPGVGGRLLQQAGLLDRRAGQLAQGAGEGYLRVGEGAQAAVAEVERAERGGAVAQRHRHEGAQALGPDHRVDTFAVREPVVVEIVRGPDRGGLREDRAAEARVVRHPQADVEGRDVAVGDPYDHVLGGLLAQAHVRHVGLQQEPGAPGEHAQHGVQIGRCGELAGGVHQRGQLRPPVVSPRRDRCPADGTIQPGVDCLHRSPATLGLLPTHGHEKATQRDIDPQRRMPP
jgi:hypothetical protein